MKMKELIEALLSLILVVLIVFGWAVFEANKTGGDFRLKDFFEREDLVFWWKDKGEMLKSHIQNGNYIQFKRMVSAYDKKDLIYISDWGRFSRFKGYSDNKCGRGVTSYLAYFGVNGSRETIDWIYLVDENLDSYKSILLCAFAGENIKLVKELADQCFGADCGTEIQDLIKFSYLYLFSPKLMGVKRDLTSKKLIEIADIINYNSPRERNFPIYLNTYYSSNDEKMKPIDYVREAYRKKGENIPTELREIIDYSYIMKIVNAEEEEERKYARKLRREKDRENTRKFWRGVGKAFGFIDDNSSHSSYSSSSYSSSNNNVYEEEQRCKNLKKSCLANCAGLSSRNPGQGTFSSAWWGDGPRQKCEHKCRDISC